MKVSASSTLERWAAPGKQGQPATWDQGLKFFSLLSRRGLV